MADLRTPRMKPGAQQNWEICDRAGLNIVVLYAGSAAAAVASASRLLSIAPDALRAKPLPAHLETPAEARPHAPPAAWGGLDDEF